MNNINIAILVVVAVVVIGFIVGMTRENINFSVGGSTDKDSSSGFFNFGDRGNQFGIGAQTGKGGTSGNISYTDEMPVYNNYSPRPSLSGFSPLPPMVSAGFL